MAVQKGKNLVIVESPSKAKTINKFLGKNYQVLASNGHVKDLPKNKLSIDIENNFEARYITVKNKGKILSELKTAAAKSDKVYLATDPDREGETISYHLYEELKKKNPNIYRITFNEITKDAILKSIKKPGQVKETLVDAGITRRLLDRLVGYKISPLLWKKLMKGLSAGRVQSVALKIICEREEEIKAFDIEEYWTVNFLINKDDKEVKFRLVDEKGKERHLENESESKKIVNYCKGKNIDIISVAKKNKKKSPPPPFITSTLQQEGSRRLNFTAKKTMMIAQKLYEGMDIGGKSSGLITYMRTDSVRISNQAIDSLREEIVKKFGEKYLNPEIRRYKSKKSAQDAHEAIRPTDITLTPDIVGKYMDKDSFRLYSLIYNKFLSTQMSPALYEQTAVKGQIGELNVKTTGNVMKFDGYLKCYKNIDNENETILPEIKEGEKHIIKEILPEQHFTQPPPRYNEASLIKFLEEKGIGRPSTYAAILTTIQYRKYVKKDKGRFMPTELGTLTNKLLLHSFPDIVNVDFTAKMEEDLDLIEEAKTDKLSVLKDFYDIFDKDLKKAETDMPDIKKELEQETEHICEKCGAPMVVKWGRYGKFLACTNFPECKHVKSLVLNKEGELEIEKEEKPEGTCPKCGAELVYKRGRFGRFIACSNYSKSKDGCHYTTNDKLGLKCPKPGCGGDIIILSFSRGIMYGCSNYPDCDFRSYKKPLEMKCEKCGYPVMIEKNTKRKGDIYECLNKECKHTVPIEKQTDED